MSYSTTELNAAIDAILGEGATAHFTKEGTPLPGVLGQAIIGAFLEGREGPEVEILRTAGRDLNSHGHFHFSDGPAHHHHDH